MICGRYADFIRGRIRTNDVECSDRPNEAVTQENIGHILKIVTDDHKLKVPEIAEIVNISMEMYLGFYTKH